MSIYEVINVEQGTDAWLRERLKRVTASQTPSLFGLSKYQSLYQLLEEKITGQETIQKNEFIFKKGHEAELAARHWAEADLGFKLPPAVIVSHHCENLLASLDGFNEEQNVILEAKYMGAKSLEDLKQGKLNPSHECQVQAQLLASGATHCIYFATAINGDSAILQIKPNPEYHEKLKVAVSDFMADLNELEKFKENLLSKYRIKSQPPLKTLASGARDPFRMKMR